MKIEQSDLNFKEHGENSGLDYDGFAFKMLIFIHMLI